MADQRRGYMVIGPGVPETKLQPKGIVIIVVAALFAVALVSATITLAVLRHQNEEADDAEDIELDANLDVPSLPEGFVGLKQPNPIITISDEDGAEAFRQAFFNLPTYEADDEDMDDNPDNETIPGHRHFSIGKPMCNETRERITWGSIREEAWRHLMNTGKAQGLALYQGEEDHQCQKDMKQKCSSKDKGPYRSLDGSCNNLRNVSWGSANRAYRRLLPANYQDGVSQPSSGVHSAREVSAMFHTPRINKDRTRSSLMTLWGQFVAHDITRVAASSGKGGRRIQCCKGSSSKLHPDCFPIKVSREDPFYADHHVRCLDFVRSASAARSGCVIGPREQLNTLTSFLDASAIYGSSNEESCNLRTGKGGMLLSAVHGDEELLPVGEYDGSCGRNSSCFVAGDVRANENALLTAMHTLWLRQHNLIARQLSSLNANWSDEQLFQETRRLVVAQIQHITFNEYIPTLLGDKTVSDFGLRLVAEGYFNDYDDEVDATVSNEFAVAAFRFGHSTVQGLVELLSGSNFEVVQLRKTFFNAEPFWRNETVDRLLFGASNQNSEGSDRFFTPQLTNHLFASKESGFGLDLVAVNIQRGRDHGMPSYNDYRKLCGMSPIQTWDQLAQVTDARSSNLLQQLYEGDIDAVELYSAGLAEKNVDGGIVGPTFACIIGEQLRSTRNGDRFWYENRPPGNPYPFTSDQLSQVRKTNLARIMCDNLRIKNIHPKALLVPSDSNKPVTCLGSAIPSVDLNFWQYSDNEDYNYLS